MEYKQRIDDITATCNGTQATAEAVNSQLRDCLTDLGSKITQDNMGTRSNKGSVFNNLVESTGVLSEVQEIAELIMEAIK
jgi:hypothetical protein